MLTQLLIDIGNTRLKWVLMQTDVLLAGGQWGHYGEASLELSQIVIKEAPEQIVVSNVTGDKFRSEIERWAAKSFSLAVNFIVVPSKELGVTNGYSVADELGADRWVSLVACHHLFETDICVIDAGSALTIDLLNANGDHLGGYILPGITSMRRALKQDTMLKQEIKGMDNGAKLTPGKSTEQCINNGSLFALCQTIEAVVHNFEHESKRKVQCILTGGDGNQLSGNLGIAHILKPTLVLQGLAIIGKHLAQSS